MGCISKFAYATLLGLVVSLASGVALSQEDEEIEGTVVDLGEDSPALHFPIGMSGKQVLVVPAFEDYAFMLEDACNAMKLTVWLQHSAYECGSWRERHRDHSGW